MAGMPPPQEWLLERAMENRFAEAEQRIPAGLQAGSGYVKPLGPRVPAVIGCGPVLTRSEQDEQDQRRRECRDVGKY